MKSMSADESFYRMAGNFWIFASWVDTMKLGWPNFLCSVSHACAYLALEYPKPFMALLALPLTRLFTLLSIIERNVPLHSGHSRSLSSKSRGFSFGEFFCCKLDDKLPIYDEPAGSIDNEIRTDVSGLLWKRLETFVCLTKGSSVSSTNPRLPDDTLSAQSVWNWKKHSLLRRLYSERRLWCHWIVHKKFLIVAFIINNFFSLICCFLYI